MLVPREISAVPLVRRWCDAALIAWGAAKQHGGESPGLQAGEVSALKIAGFSPGAPAAKLPQCGTALHSTNADRVLKQANQSRTEALDCPRSEDGFSLDSLGHIECAIQEVNQARPQFDSPDHP